MKSTFSGLQFCCWQYGSIWIRLAVVAFPNHEITRNSDKIWPYCSSRSSKVIDLGVNWKPRCDFLLVINSNFGRICFSRYWRLKPENAMFSPQLPCLTPRSGWPLSNFVMKFRIRKLMGLPEGEKITTLAFFVLTQYRCVTDGWTDGQRGRHVTVTKTRASKRRAGNKKAQLTLSNPRDVKACKNCYNSTCFVSFHRIPFPPISKFRPRPI